MLLRVSPATLRSLSRRLGEATIVARDIRDQRAGLQGLLDDPGDEALAGSARRFIDKWAHGVGCFEADAGLLATRLLRAEEVYVDVDDALVAGLSGRAP